MEIINLVLETTVHFKDVQVFLNYIPTIWNLPPGLELWVKRGLGSAKCPMLQFWKKPSPSIQQWINDLHSLPLFELAIYQPEHKEEIQDHLAYISSDLGILVSSLVYFCNNSLYGQNTLTHHLSRFDFPTFLYVTLIVLFKNCNKNTPGLFLK